jgi:hypothetical protein
LTRPARVRDPSIHQPLEHRRNGLGFKQGFQSLLKPVVRRQSHGERLLAHLPTEGNLFAGTLTIVFQKKTKEFDLQL